MLLDSTLSTRYDWLVDSSPTDILRRDAIGEPRVPALNALELGLRRSVALVDTPTCRAGTASIVWINQQNWNTHKPTLVLNKPAKLKERPRCQRIPLGATNRKPAANAREIFERNCTAGVFRLGDDTLCNNVVHILRKPSFFARELFKFTLGRASTSYLQFSPQTTIPTANVVNLFARMDLPVGVDSNVDYAQVHTKNAFNITNGWFLHIAGGRQNPAVPDKHQVSLSSSSYQKLALSISTDKGDSHTTLDSPDRDSTIREAIGHNAVIISDGTKWLESALSLTIKLISIRNLGTNTNSNLGRKSKFVTNSAVAKVMQVILSESLLAPGCLRDEVTGSVGRLNRFTKSNSLDNIREKLKLSNKFHILKYNMVRCKTQDLKGGGCFLCRLKATVSTPDLK